MAASEDVLRWRRSNRAEKRPPFVSLIKTLTAKHPETAVVVPKDDPDIEAISSKGKFFPVTGRKFSKGSPNSCHWNVIALLEKGKVESMATGYALSDDGGWRSHTWGFVGDSIVETTFKYTAYFGVKLTKSGVRKFIEINSTTKKDATRMAKFPKAWVAANAAVERKQEVNARINMSAEVAGQGKCPECQKDMEIVTSGTAKVWSCAHDRITLPLPDGYKG